MSFCYVIHLTEDKDVSSTRQETGTDHEATLGCYQASKTSAYHNEVPYLESVSQDGSTSSA